MANREKLYQQLVQGTLANDGTGQNLANMMLKHGFDPTLASKAKSDFDEAIGDRGDVSVGGFSYNKGGREMSSEQVTKLGDSENALNSILSIEKKLEGRRDIGGPISGRAKLLFGEDEMKALDADFGSTAQIVGSYLEGGKLAEGDIGRYLKMLPSATDEASVRESKIKSMKELIDRKKKTDLENLARSGFDVSGFAKGDIAEKQPAKLNPNIEGAFKQAQANPDDPRSQKFLAEVEAGKWDLKTGVKMKTFEELNPLEKQMVKQGIEVPGYTPEVEEEKKGFGEAFGELSEAEKELRGITEQQEGLGKGIEERTQRAKDLSLVNNYERALENKDTDEMAQAFLDRLTDEDKAKIEELQKMTPEEREAERQELLTGQRETQEKLGEFGEQIDTATKKGEEAIKANRGLETLVDVAEVGEKDIEIVADRVGNIVDAFKKEQAIGSKGVQAIGEIFAGAGEIGFESTKGLAKAGLSEESEQAIAGVASDSLERMLETKAGQAIMEKAIEGGEAWDAYAKENPEDATNIKALLNIAEGAIGFKGSKVADTLGKKGFQVAGGKIKGVAGDVAKGAKEGFEKQAVKQGVKATEKEVAKSAGKVGELEEMIMPKMTTKELGKASLEGRVTRGKKSKLTGKAKDIVEASETIKKDADLIRNKIKGFDKLDDQQLSQKVDIEGNKIFNKIKPEMEKAELKADTINKKVKVWDKIKKQQAGDPDFEAFGGKKLQSNFENILGEIKKGTKDTKGKFRKKSLNDLWELRQKYDKLVPDRIKNADSLSDSRAQYQKDVWLENRKVLNDIINDTAKDLGVNTAKAFEEMSAFKRIRQNIASKTKLEKAEEGLTGKAKKKLIGTGAAVGLTATGTALGVKGLQ